MSSPLALTVRPASPSDAERLTALLVAQLREHSITIPAASVAASIAATLGDPERGFILAAAVGDVIEGVAFVSFARPLEHAGEVAWVEELYVTPERRSLGIGRRLLDAVAERAEARGCVSLELEVQADHARAAHLYQREGFRSMRRDHLTRPLAGWDW
jgi:ribosomal protein S18 acetylase RimI-like enzyme